MRNSGLRLLIFGAILCLLSIGCAPIEVLPVAEEVARARAMERLLKQASIDLERNTPRALNRAEGALRLVSEIAPEEPRALDGLGCIAFRRKRFGEAEGFFKKALDVAPDYAAAWAHLALIAEGRGHLHAAKALYQRALEKNPLNYRARNNYAVFILENLQSPSSGFEELQKALAQGGTREAILSNNTEYILVNSQAKAD
jgi:tetratricopeptide (TPR) repeat protein